MITNQPKSLSLVIAKQCPPPQAIYITVWFSSADILVTFSTLISSPVAHSPCSFQPKACTLPPEMKIAWNALQKDYGKKRKSYHFTKKKRKNLNINYGGF